MVFQRLMLVAGLCAVTASCDIPTSAPLIEQRWVLPLEEVTMDQAELLPPDISVSGSFYDVNAAPVSSSESLGTLCPPCSALNGMTVPTPAYQGTFTTVDALPNDILSADVESGAIDVTITNGLSFDPLANGGSLTITIQGASGGPVLAVLSLVDGVDAMPPGSVTNRTVLLSGGTVDGAIETVVEVVHGGGEVATIDTADRIQLDGVTTSLLVSEATVAVDGVSASLGAQDLGADDIDDGLIDRILEGAVVLDVVNPFGVTFTGTINVGPVTKNVSVTADPTSTVQVPFTGAELQSVLRTPGATFSGSGTISGGPAVVTPTLVFEIDPTIDLTIELGG